jgi:hypothetical protein
MLVHVSSSKGEQKVSVNVVLSGTQRGGQGLTHVVLLVLGEEALSC